MGRKILRWLIWAGITLLALIFLIFILGKLGIVAGTSIAIAILVAGFFGIRYLISSGKIITEASSKRKLFRKKRQGRRMPAGGSGDRGFLKSGVRIADKKSGKLATFKDVAGCEETKEQLQEIVDILQNPKKFRRLGARVPKGILLVGPPGTGKTLLARATAGEANVAFLSINGSEFVELYVGVGASRVRDLFNQARNYADDYGGAIVFIDEIDAIGGPRSAFPSGGHEEKDQTLNQLFAEMDGFKKDDNIVVMAATNRPEILDPALVRKGRFDRKAVVDLPDRKGRCDILKIHTRNKKLSEHVDLDALAGDSPGFSGADLENLANEAAIIAARKGKKEIEMEDFEKAMAMVTVGPERKSRKISDTERKIIAYHEAGHAVVGRLLPEIDPLREISIIQTGFGAGGYTRIRPKEDRYLYTKRFLFAQLKVLFAGRIAEEIVFGSEEISTGAEHDLKEADKIIRAIVCDYGMSKLGPGIFGERQGSAFLPGVVSRQKNYSEQTAKEIDEEIKTIRKETHEEARELLTKNRSALDVLAETLLIEDKLTGEEVINKIIDDNLAKK